MPAAVIRPLGTGRRAAELFGLGLYGLKPLKGTLVVAVPSEMVSRLSIPFYGGSGAAPAVQAREFTATEEAVGKAQRRFGRGDDEVWRETAPIEPQRALAKTNSLCPQRPARTRRWSSVASACAGVGKADAIDILIPAPRSVVEGALRPRARRRLARHRMAGAANTRRSATCASRPALCLPGPS